MKRLYIQILALVLPFAMVWAGLSLVPWTDWFGIKEKVSSLEKKLGDFYTDILIKYEDVLKDDELKAPVDSIMLNLCQSNGIDRDKIKVYVVKNSQVNAFALPDNNMVVYTGLIDYCADAEELAGVMAHELAHLQKGHIMKKLSREIGFASLSMMITGGSVGPEALRMVASTSYDRKMETEADMTAVEYMLASGIDPAPMANLMFRLSVDESDLIKMLSFLSTHPDSESRAEKILEGLLGESGEFKLIMDADRWSDYKERINRAFD